LTADPKRWIAVTEPQRPCARLFGRRFGDLPLILNGVIDPETTAHGPDESLHLGVFKKAILANVFLYDELGALTELVRS
jgi:ABC-type taurine transport system substrate-binding protein